VRRVRSSDKLPIERDENSLLAAEKIEKRDRAAAVIGFSLLRDPVHPSSQSCKFTPKKRRVWMHLPPISTSGPAN
jgi:hypothetical protein